MIYKKICVILLFLLIGQIGWAQQFWPFNQMLKPLSQSQSGIQDIAYDYKVIIEDLSEKKAIDSIFGHLIYSKNRFIDSNNQYITCRNNQYYCKIDFEDKIVDFINIDLFKKKLKIKSLSTEPKSMLLIGDDFLNDGNKVELDITNRFTNRIIIRPQEDVVKFLQIDLRKSDNQIIAAYFEIEDTESDIEKTYVTKYFFFNFSNKVNEKIFNFSRIFTIVNENVILNKKFESYKINKLI